MRSRSLLIAYSLLLVYVSVLAIAVFDARQILLAAQATLDTPLTCNLAYQTRSIDRWFYPARWLQGNLIYMSAVCMGPVLLGFAGLTTMLLTGVGFPKGKGRAALRWRRGLGALGVVALLGVLAQLDTIYLIACATE